MGKKSILIVIIFSLIIGATIIGLIIKGKSKNIVKIEPNIVRYEYGTSSGDMGFGCQGNNNYYFLRWDSLNDGGYDMYAVSSENEVREVDSAVHNLNYYNGYVYYEKCVGELNYIYKINDSTGEKEIVVDPCIFLGQNYKFAYIWYMHLVDGVIFFDIEYGNNKSNGWNYETYCYNCDSGSIEKIDESKSSVSNNHGDLRDEIYTGDYDLDLKWMYQKGDFYDPNKQYYGEYMYGIAKTPDTEETEDWSDCYYAPRDFCMIKTWEVMDGEAGNDLIKLDTQVTHFNVGYEYIYYAKSEFKSTSIWRRDLDGENPIKITTIENSSWVIDILAGDNVLICTFSDWGSNRDLHASEKVYEIYFVNVDSGEVTILDDKISTE